LRLEFATINSCYDNLYQEQGTCNLQAKYGPHEHFIWPASEFLLTKLEYNIASKRKLHDKPILDSQSREITLIVKGRILGLN